MKNFHPVTKLNRLPKTYLQVLALLLIILLSACSTTDKKEQATTGEPVGTKSAPIKNNNLVTEQRKLIKKGTVKYKTANLTETRNNLLTLTKQLNGYIANDNSLEYHNRSEISLTIRVPAENFDTLLTSLIKQAGKIDKKEIEVLDVTSEYVDVNARIKTKKLLLERYNQLLQKAVNMDEVLKIEKEINKIQEEIEKNEGQFNLLKDQIALSTLQITIYDAKQQEFGFGTKIKEAFIKGWEIFLWLIITLSHLWVLITITIITWLIILRWKKAKKKN